jgi:hypothetical protein
MVNSTRKGKLNVPNSGISAVGRGASDTGRHYPPSLKRSYVRTGVDLWISVRVRRRLAADGGAA